MIKETEGKPDCFSSIWNWDGMNQMTKLSALPLCHESTKCRASSLKGMFHETCFILGVEKSAGTVNWLQRTKKAEVTVD